MRILVFYHILLINHYLEIVSEQINILVSSGLYDAAEKIYVGCLGELDQIEKLKPLFSAYPKIEISYHSTDVHEYEFATLKILKQKSDEEELFYGLYFHVKGVSYSRSRPQAYSGGIYWRNYMEYYNIKKWKDCVAKLHEGFDTCGVKLLAPHESPAKCQHYSGNFFWIRSEYAKTLKSIESLKQDDRMQAEFWQCSGNPKAATLCQDFIDYTAKGKFIPPHE